jgi:hypothetical protein
VGGDGFEPGRQMAAKGAGGLRTTDERNCEGIRRASAQALDAARCTPLYSA